MPRPDSLSVLVPVYNEQELVAASLERLKVLGTSPRLERVQVIVVDDCSTDHTPAVLERFRESLPAEAGKLRWDFHRHERNLGKGGAVRTALEHARCELVVIHDADLEYDPEDLLRMLALFQEGQADADAVYGSRFLARDPERREYFRHYLGNRVLTLVCNLVCGVHLTDMETCYKMVRTELLRSIPLVSRDYRIEPEVTIKLARRGARIREVPIRYAGRTFEQGKKINWKDGVLALGAILHFRFGGGMVKSAEMRPGP